MCGIAGFFRKNGDYEQHAEQYQHVLNQMNIAQRHRGSDGQDLYLDSNCGLAHVQLSLSDIKQKPQPMHFTWQEQDYVIVYDGEIYNMPTLRKELEVEGLSFSAAGDAEVVLKGYCKYGIDFIPRLNGVFAFAVWEGRSKRLFLCRDRIGAKPLYFTEMDDTIIFASEVKGILCYPNAKAQANKDNLCELFALGPAHTAGKCVFQNIFEVLPGHHMTCSLSGKTSVCYWDLKSHEHTDNESVTIAKTRDLITDAIKMQMRSDASICTFLSGGLDSSIVSSVCAIQLKQEGRKLSTYSFDFPENDAYFQANGFQPSQDGPFAQEMADYLNTNHTRLLCTNQTLVDYLTKTVDARDYPCMADVESSLLYFCEQVTGKHKVALAGECADEIFGGYPWFYRQDMFERANFPWSYDMQARTALLKQDVIDALPLQEYAYNAYAETIKQTPILHGETKEQARRRELSYLNLKWFMATLLERMERTSMYSGLQARVPFADYRIIEYIFNVPWELKSLNGHGKGLLRRAAEGLLPNSVLYRKKSPYPKTYHPMFENLLKEQVRNLLSDQTEPIHAFIDRQKAEQFLTLPTEYGKPWYGQLMAGPQMLAYMIQTNYWLKKYHVDVKLI